MNRIEIVVLILAVITVVLVVKGADQDFIPIAQDQRENFRVIMVQYEVLQKSLDLIRIQSCWQEGIKPEECGQLDPQRGVILRVKPKQKAPDAP